MEFTDIGLSKAAEDFTLKYGTMVIENRAIPDFRDGLKPVQRRILWDMYVLGLKSKGPFKKAARTVGDTIAKYHPHGDSALYGAMVNMVNSPEPLIEGHGNWGDFNNPAAAYRYTEARLSEYADNYLLDPDYLAVVPMVPNYDGDTTEPVFLPAKLPNLLLNGSSGIAVGCSLGIPSYSRDSVVKLVSMALKGKKITPKMCAKHLEFNFTYGGINVNDDNELVEFYKTGNMSLSFQPEFEKKSNKIVITSLAPRFKFDTKFEKLGELKAVRTVENKTAKGKINLEVVFKKDHDASDINAAKRIITSTLPCQTKITIRRKDGNGADFKETTIPDIINRWIKWRIALETAVVKRLIKLERQKLQKQQWLLFAVMNRKDIINALDSDDPDQYLIDHFDILEEQAKFILDLQVRKLAKLETQPIKKRIKLIKIEINKLKTDLTNIPARIAGQLEM